MRAAHPRHPICTVAAPLAAALALLVAGCGGSSSSSSSSSGGSSGAATSGSSTASSGSSGSGSSSASSGSGATLTVADIDLDTLLPAATELSFNEDEELWTPIVAFNADGSIKDVQAQSISESKGDTVWTIHFRPGWTFSNGQPVTAASYEDGWNFAADKANANVNASELAEIKGYSAVNPATGKPTATKLSGLKILSKDVLQVTLSKPDSQFASELCEGDTAFYPMPTVGLKDPAKFKTDPIGDGPYEMAAPANLNEQVALKAYPGYKGTKPKTANLTFKLFSSADTAYTATQAGQVDIDATTPQDKFSSIKQDFGSRVVDVPGESVDFLGFPIFEKQYANPDIREAVSLAIDRPAIIKALFGGQDTPATGVLGTGLIGGGTKQCDYCTYDPTKARALLAKAGGFSGSMTIMYPGGSGYDQEFQAIANELSQNLKIKATAVPTSGFSPFLAALQAKKYTQGPFRGHWGSLTPVAGTVLSEVFAKGGEGDDATGYYDSPKVDRLVAAGNRAPSSAAAVKDYQQAEQVILDDRVVAPLFYPVYPYVYGPNVHGLTALPHEIGVDFNAVTLS